MLAIVPPVARLPTSRAVVVDGSKNRHANTYLILDTHRDCIVEKFRCIYRDRAPGSLKAVKTMIPLAVIAWSIIFS